MPVAQSVNLSSDADAFDGDGRHEAAAFVHRGRCSCIHSLRSNLSQSWWEQIRAADINDRWWLRGWKRFRQWSEFVAGPKCKTFIRRFNKNHNRQSTFRYDPLSYALNFDAGPAHDDSYSDDFVRRDFSTRFAKSSMDFGKDGPSFI